MRIVTLMPLLLLFIAGCDETARTVPSGEGGANTSTSDTVTATATPAPAGFNRETAETITAMYFADQNRQAKYQRYKGLLVDIDTIYAPGEDGSRSFQALVDGRRWETPNGDTITLPFKDTLTMRAAWDGNMWKGQRTDR